MSPGFLGAHVDHIGLEAALELRHGLVVAGEHRRLHVEVGIGTAADDREGGVTGSGAGK
jgi:hypothetical protein